MTERMLDPMYDQKPAVGTVVAFKDTASQALAHIPGKVTRILAELADGDYLVSIEYPKPVSVKAAQFTRIDALASRLYHPAA